MPILDWWLVIKCLTSVIKSIQEMQMCLQMGVWTSVYGSSVLLCGCVEVDCWRVDQCGRVHGIDWKFGQVLKCSSPSVELCNAWLCLVVLKCWSVEVWVRVKKPYLPPTPGPRTRSRPRPKLILFHTLTHSIYYTAIPHSLNNSEQCSLGSVGVTGWRTDLITRHKTALTPDIAPVIPSLVFDSQIIDINGQGWGESTWPWPSQKVPKRVVSISENKHLWLYTQDCVTTQLFDNLYL